MIGALRAYEREVTISGPGVTLPGILGLPNGAIGAVLFAHGSGSGRFSPRNNAVARTLHDARLATLLVDLLTEQESSDRRNVFDIRLLAERLELCTAWLGQNQETGSLAIGYFGASTGAAAALVAAAELGNDIRAVVSRGGRPDLAGDYLDDVQSPTLLIVGGEDRAVIVLNEQAFARLHCTKQLVIVPG
ncbi:MAG TPA: alpha/beta hydrolase, partial [Chloroflexota bacterium]